MFAEVTIDEIRAHISGVRADAALVEKQLKWIESYLSRWEDNLLEDDEYSRVVYAEGIYTVLKKTRGRVGNIRSGLEELAVD